MVCGSDGSRGAGDIALSWYSAWRDILPQDVIIGAIVRDGEVIIARANTMIESGDRVILLSAAHAVKKVEKCSQFGSSSLGVLIHAQTSVR